MHVPAEDVVVVPRVAPVTVVTAPKWWSVIVNGPCAHCGVVFTATGASSRYCSARCARRVHEGRRGKFQPSPLLRQAVYERDGFVCQLCYEPVDSSADPWSDWFPSLDHVVPRSKGGSDEADNLRTAHRWCNAVRGAEDYHADLFGSRGVVGSVA